MHEKMQCRNNNKPTALTLLGYNMYHRTTATTTRNTQQQKQEKVFNSQSNVCNFFKLKKCGFLIGQNSIKTQKGGCFAQGDFDTLVLVTLPATTNGEGCILFLGKNST